MDAPRYELNKNDLLSRLTDVECSRLKVWELQLILGRADVDKDMDSDYVSIEITHNWDSLIDLAGRLGVMIPVEKLWLGHVTKNGKRRRDLRREKLDLGLAEFRQLAPTD